ncbi:hypothetical protein Pmani_001690 [Petrolisthes manimaculis]|uniref:Uncharacterized protein n=1 Tax=Petrolisthes manimaculis TaxID=1843537 RepID=A0AAE1QJZ7_9EUCA|nr:hypothetical protein Pmani_001690 [Petrolisthes manimaculis]
MPECRECIWGLQENNLTSDTAPTPPPPSPSPSPSPSGTTPQQLSSLAHHLHASFQSHHHLARLLMGDLELELDGDGSSEYQAPQGDASSLMPDATQNKLKGSKRCECRDAEAEEEVREAEEGGRAKRLRTEHLVLT